MDTIKQSVDSILASKGLKVDEGADLNVDYQAALSKAEKWEAYEDWSDTGFGPERLPEHKKVIIDVGILVVDMYDRADKELVWTGSAQKTVDLNSSPKERQKISTMPRGDCSQTFRHSNRTVLHH